jgi:hypothetical protein
MKANAMGKQSKAQELRELLALAKQLRGSAAGTADHIYVELFLRAAAALEDRASRLAYGSLETKAVSEVDAASHAPINLVC